MTDFYRIGAGFGDAYTEGTTARDAAQLRALNIRRQTGEIDDAEYARQRARGMDTERDNMEGGLPTPGVAAPSAGVPAPSAAPIGSRDVAPPAAPDIAPGVGASPAGVPRAAPTEADRLRLTASQLYRKGDAKGGHEAEVGARGEDFRASYNAGAKADLTTVMSTANLNNKGLVVHQEPGKEGYEFLIVRPDGTTHKVEASEAQARQIAGFKNAMKVDPQKALDGIAKIDADLATLFHTQLDDQVKVSQANNQATHFSNTDAIARDNTAARIEIAGMRMDMATLRMETAKAGKEMDPDSAAIVNEKVAAMDAVRNDPAAYQKAFQDYKVALASGLAKMGKVMQPDTRQQPDEKTNADGSITKSGVTYVPNPAYKRGGSEPMYIRPSGLEPDAIDKFLAGKGGGAPAAGPKAAGIPARPPAPPQRGRGTGYNPPVEPAPRRGQN